MYRYVHNQPLIAGDPSGLQEAVGVAFDGGKIAAQVKEVATGDRITIVYVGKSAKQVRWINMFSFRILQLYEKEVIHYSETLKHPSIPFDLVPLSPNNPRTYHVDVGTVGKLPKTPYYHDPDPLPNTGAGQVTDKFSAMIDRQPAAKVLGDLVFAANQKNKGFLGVCVEIFNRSYAVNISNYKVVAIVSWDTSYRRGKLPGYDGKIHISKPVIHKGWFAGFKFYNDHLLKLYPNYGDGKGMILEK